MKQVRPVFVVEDEIITIITVYTYFFLVMKISYDPKADALSIVFRDTTVTTHELETGIAADYDSEGRLAGLEILDVAQRFGGLSTLAQVTLEGVGML
ncbi:MAG TPA: DUF2283 domain-containing protein, partial [Candidatus Kapabacteria bacterium]|nr:DUF2283 domain-containing protein [Candidatus Kapabacteria bacterium]